MRTPEQVYHDISLLQMTSHHPDKDSIESLKAAMLEAYRAGLTRAAEIAKLREDGSLGQTSARANIVARIIEERDSKTTS